jgi:hypothetical protein
LVTTVDMMPTILGLSDVAVPDAVEELDLSALFEGTSSEQREAAFLFNVHAAAGRVPTGEVFAPKSGYTPCITPGTG